jgi:alpha-galactosidase
VYDSDPVRFEVMKHFGAFVTESSGHLSEYLPYFRKRPDLIARYTRGGYRGESGFYTNNWPSWRLGGDDSNREALNGRTQVHLQRSGECASTIIEAIELGTPRAIHGNVLNRDLIDNLPSDGCVDVPVLVDAMGLHPVRFGPLPPQMAALDRAHAAPHELMVAAVLDRDRDAARRGTRSCWIPSLPPSAPWTRCTRSLTRCGKPSVRTSRTTNDDRKDTAVTGSHGPSTPSLKFTIH